MSREASYMKPPKVRRIMSFTLIIRMKELGYRTMTDFCKAKGFNLGYMSRIVNGWQIPSEPEQARIAEALDTTSDQIFDVDTNPNVR